MKLKLIEIAIKIEIVFGIEQRVKGIELNWIELKINLELRNCNGIDINI